MDLLQVFVNWLLLGCLYAAIALGFSLVWGIMNIVNLAHGAFILLGAYIAYTLYESSHIDPYLGIIFPMLSLFVIGWVVQYVAINRVIRAPLLVTFLFTFGLELLVLDLIQHFFSPDMHSINVAYAGTGLDIGRTHIPLNGTLAALIGIVLTVILSLFLARTRIGNAILATGMDRDAARLMGIDIRMTYALTFALGAALAGGAGALLSELYPFNPSIGGPFTLRSFVIVVLGGLGTPLAVIAGGLVFALAETIVPLVPGLGPGYDNAVAFALLVLVLIFRPNGLLGKQFYS